MLKIGTYYREESLCSENLKSIFETTADILIVGPGPEVADDIRKRLIDLNLGESINVTTMAHFVSGELAEILDEKTMENKVNKANLLMTLSSAWKIKFPHLGFESFLNCFNLFTKISSIGVKSQATEELINCLDQDKQNALVLFYQLVDQLGLIDESKCYQILIDSEKTVERCERQIIFWGFTFLSPIQLDYIKALSENNEILIPLPKLVVEKRHFSDWVSWLIEGNSFLELFQIDEEIKLASDVNIFFFNKGDLGPAIKKNILEKKVEEQIDIILGTKGISFEKLNEIPLLNINFKSTVNIFGSITTKVFKDIEKNYFIDSEKVCTDEILLSLNRKIENWFGDISNKNNYRDLKVSISLVKLIKQWQEMGQANSDMTYFDLLALKYIFELNLPRVFSMPVISKNHIGGRLIDLNGLRQWSEQAETYFCIESEYGQLKTFGSNYPESLMKIMATLGPIERGELEFLFLKQKIDQIIHSQKTTIFCEKGVIQEDPGWSEILDDNNLNNDMIFLDPSHDEILDPIAKMVIPPSKIGNRFSSTKIQSYLDCPRKYYFKYESNQLSYIKKKQQLYHFQLGRMEHALISAYFSQYDFFDETYYAELSLNILYNFLGQEGLKISNHEIQRSLMELRLYSRRALNFLFSLKSILGDCHFKFEKNFSYQKDCQIYTGQCDCLIESKYGIGLIDFKRSSSGIPTLAEVASLKSIQLSFYRSFLGFEESEYFFSGYLNLADVDNSLFYFENKKNPALSKKIAEVIKIKKLHNYPHGVPFLRGYFSTQVERLRAEHDFNPSPRELKICTFCELKSVCIKQIIPEECVDEAK